MKGTPYWGQRAQSVVADQKMSAIIFLQEQGALERETYLKDDWRYKIMTRVTEMIRNDGYLFIPIFAEADYEEKY